LAGGARSDDMPAAAAAAADAAATQRAPAGHWPASAHWRRRAAI